MSTTTPAGVADAIAHLRDLQPIEAQVFTVEQIRTIVDDIYNARPLEFTMGREEFADIAVADLLGIVEEFGKHRARVHKRGETAAVLASDIGVLPGFEPARDEVLELAARATLKRTLKRKTGDVPKLSPNERLLLDSLGGTPVVIPSGYEHGAYQTRDITKSLTATVVDRPSDAEIERFQVRHFDRPTAVLSADHVHLLHWVITNGLTDKLLQLGSSEHTLAQMLVKSYELLDVARMDAVEGVRFILSANPTTVDPHQLQSAVTKSAWLYPAEFARLERVVTELNRTPDNSRVRDLLDKRLVGFRTALGSSDVINALSGVEHMNQGHLLGILRAAGLTGDELEEKQVVAHLRERLTAFGLANDLDREIPEGVKAWRLNKLEDFLSSREARAAGDPDWAAVYAAAIAAAEAEATHTVTV